MYFSTIITLCFNYLLCHRVGSLHHSLLNSLMVFNEDVNDVIDQFFVHFKKAYLQKHEPRQVTVVAGRSTKYLHQVQPLFESYPHLICTDTKGFVYPMDLSPGNFVVIFLRDLSEETLKKNIDIFSTRCTECRVLFVAEGTIGVRDIWLLFNLAAEQNLGYVEFAHRDKNVVKLYSHFIASNNCSMEVRLMIDWKPGISLNNIDTWAFLERGLNGCSVSVSTSSFEPKMIINTSENGSVTIAGGREGELVLATAKALNFTVALRSPSVRQRLKYSRKASIVNDVVSGIAEIGIGRLRPSNDLHESMMHSVMYDDECITWGVPRIMKWSNNVVWVEFTWKVWALVGLIFVIGCTIGYSLQKMYMPKNGIRTEIGFVTIVLDVIAIHLGNPVVNVPVPLGGKFALIAFLGYAMVLTTAYKTSLASILTTEKGTPTIVDVEGIIRANLSIGGSQYDFNMLKDQVDDSEINLKLVERFVVNNNDSETLQRLKCNQDFAFLARGSSLHDEKQRSVRNHEKLTFDVFNRCVLAYHTVMIVRKGSFLRKPVNLVIRRLGEAGILEHWDIDKFDADKILIRRSAEKFFEERAGNKFKTIFLLYFCCIVLCIVTFFFELITSKFNSKKGHPIATPGL